MLSQTVYGHAGRICAAIGSFITADMPVIWTGDFNVALDPIDVYDPQELMVKAFKCRLIPVSVTQVGDTFFTPF